MKRNVEALSKQRFDLAIIGGGIQGACTAREAALRGLKVALVEARDFANATSSRSSKLIHGGLRYLEQLEFKLVREARGERMLLLKLAPHLARPVPFLLPIYHGDPYSPVKIRLGLSIYDLMGNLGRGDRHRMLGHDEALRLMPALRAAGLRAAAIYHDSTTDDARLTIENVIDAADHGAVVVNYAELRQLSIRSGNEVSAGEVEDRLTGKKYELVARFWINAAGPWVDRVRDLIPGSDGSKTVRLTKGTHVIVPPVTGRHALLAAVPPGDRVFLIVPFHDYALLGTTDTDFEGDPATVAPDDADTSYLLDAASRVFAHPLAPSSVLGAWAGLRALAIEPGKPAASPSANTREYRFHEDAWARNFVTICGGKLTTARALGEKLVDLVASRLGIAASRAGSTRVTPLPGGRMDDFDRYVNDAARDAVQSFDIPHQTAARIVRTYGSRWREVLDPVRHDEDLARVLPGSPALVAAEAQFAIEHEMSITSEDFMLRRSGLSWTACLLKEAEAEISSMFTDRVGMVSFPRKRESSPGVSRG